MLGEAQSKCHHIRDAPLLPAVSRKMHEVYLAKGVAATTAIEGNTLTEEQVLQHLEGKLNVPPSKQYLQQEIQNILEACTNIAGRLFRSRPTHLCVDDILNFNRMALKDLPTEPEVQPGEIRRHSVGVLRYQGAPPEDCLYLLDRLCQWLSRGFPPVPGNVIAFGVLKAVLAHLYLAWIHPFGDGNGRTARLVEFHLLISAGVPSAAAHLLSNHYNQTRQEYYRQLDVASTSGGDVFPFMQYALQGFVDGLKEQILRIQDQQLRVLWERHVYNTFKDERTVVDRRRRDLMFDLSARFFETNEPLPFSRVRRLTPRIVEDYHGKTDRTLRRDLEILFERNLLKMEGKGIVPKLDQMQATPPRALEIENVDELDMRA